MASPSLNFITFNQDHSCLAVGELQLGNRQFHHDQSLKLTGNFQLFFSRQALLKDFAYTTQIRSRVYSAVMTGT